MTRQSSVGDISYRVVLGALAAIALLILITPVVVVLVTSFTDSRSLRFPPPALSLRWYRSLFDPVQSAQIHTAAWNSLIVALSSMAISVVLGTAAAIAIARRRPWWTQAPDALFLSAPETDVLPLRMWNMLESTLDVRTAAVSGVLIFTTALLVVVMDRVVGLTRRLS